MAVLKYHDGTGWEPVVSALQGPTGPTGVAVGLPTGGATGASLIKSSSTDYATEWSSNVGGLVHIVTDTFSAVAAVNVNNVFTFTFDDYKINFKISSSSTGDTITMRMRAAGADNTSGEYNRHNFDSITSALANRYDSGATSWNMTQTNTSGAGMSAFVLDLFKPNLAEVTNGFNLSVGRIVTSNTFTGRGGGLLQRGATSFDGFSVISGSGNITGSYSVYGYAKA